MIVPARASVYLVVSHEYWCSEAAAKAKQQSFGEAGRTLQREVQAVFGSAINTFAALIDEPNVSNSEVLNATRSAVVAARARGGLASAFTVSQVLNFKRQFQKVASAEALRECVAAQLAVQHRLIVRARLDVLFGSAVPLTALSPGRRQIFALPMEIWGARGFRDWLYVTTTAGMAAIAWAAKRGTPILFNVSRRCNGGLCPEEQVEQQLVAQGMEVLNFPGVDTSSDRGIAILRVTNLDPRLFPAAVRRDAGGSCSVGCSRLASMELHRERPCRWGDPVMRRTPLVRTCPPVKY